MSPYLISRRERLLDSSAQVAAAAGSRARHRKADNSKGADDEYNSNSRRNRAANAVQTPGPVWGPAFGGRTGALAPQTAKGILRLVVLMVCETWILNLVVSLTS